MAIINKIFCRATDFGREAGSFFRILHYRFKYPSLKIDFKSRLYENCRIVCVEGAICEIKNSQFAQGVFIVVEKKAVLTIHNSSIGPFSVIVAHEHIEIHSDCSIAEMVVIRDQDHAYDNRSKIKDLGYRSGKIVLGENVWVGAKASILKGVSIGKNSVVGAHSLVNKSFGEGSVIGGIPARLLHNP